MREEEELKLKEKERQKQELENEIINQESELWLMRCEKNKQRNVDFYKKLGINKRDMYVKFLFDMQDHGIFH